MRKLHRVHPQRIERDGFKARFVGIRAHDVDHRLNRFPLSLHKDAQSGIHIRSEARPSLEFIELLQKGGDQLLVGRHQSEKDLRMGKDRLNEATLQRAIDIDRRGEMFTQIQQDLLDMEALRGTRQIPCNDPFEGIRTTLSVRRVIRPTVQSEYTRHVIRSVY